MNKTLQLLSLQVSKHLRCFRLFLLSLLLCGFMQTMAQTWTDGNGVTWSFTINGTEATDIKFRGGPNTEWVYLYGDPNRSGEEKVENPQLPFVPGAWDAAAMRFSDTEGAHLPTIPDDVYFDLKTLIFDVSDVSEDFDMRVMNAWWSNTYYDHVKWKNGLNDLRITEVMAKECAKGGEGRDLTLMLLSGSMTLNAVFYASSAGSFAVEIPAKVYDGSTELTVTSIGNSAFSGFSGLTSVTIPEGVTSIGNWAFQNCSGLQIIECLSPTPPNCGDDCFMNVDYTTPLYVPKGSVLKYKAAKEWRNFVIIREIDDNNDIFLSINDGAHGNLNIKIDENNPYLTLKLEPDNGWHLYSVKLNDDNVTAEVWQDGKYTTPAINKNSKLTVVYAQGASSAPLMNANRIDLSSNDNELIVSGTTGGERIAVYTMNGVYVSSTVATGKQTTIPLATRQTYVVKVNDLVLKYCF